MQRTKTAVIALLNRMKGSKCSSLKFNFCFAEIAKCEKTADSIKYK